jgi:cell division protein FtsL
MFIELSYEKQKKERIKAELIEKHQELIQQQYTLTNYEQIKKFAHEQLHMDPLTMNQVMKLQDHDQRS